MTTEPSTTHSRLKRTTQIAGTLLLVGIGLTGCDDRTRPLARYSVLAGHVAACHPDTGELTIRGPRRSSTGPAEAVTYCLVTRDTEIYINDRFSSIEEIQIGDAVELIGRPDSDPQLERFVISFAYLDQPLPSPPTPELAPPIEEEKEEEQPSPGQQEG